MRVDSEVVADVTRTTNVSSSSPQWQHDPFDSRVPKAKTIAWPEFFRKHSGRLGFGVATGLLITGWLLRDFHLLNAESGLGYALGIVSVSCMSVLLLYPLRKRFRILKFIGPLPKWFRNHMILGVSAPIAALYHCNFQLGSLNDRIALFSALAVAGSGLVGRFIYSKIHRGLYGRKSTLKELLGQIKLTTPGVGNFGVLVPELTKRLSQYDRQVLVPPDGILDCFRQPLVLLFKTHIQYFRLARLVRLSLAVQARRSPVVLQHRDRLEESILKYIRNHLNQVRRVAEFTAYDRLFALWHKFHFPFFIVLLVTVVVHIAVVHLY